MVCVFICRSIPNGGIYPLMADIKTVLVIWDHFFLHRKIILFVTAVVTLKIFEPQLLKYADPLQMTKDLEVMCSQLYDYRLISKVDFIRSHHQGIQGVLTKITDDKIDSLMAHHREIATRERAKRTEENLFRELLERTHCT
jgi:hypothetical protein